MASLVLHLLTIVIALIFIFSGHLKLTGQFFPEYHSHIKNEFGKYNKEFPLHRQTGWRPYAKNYRLAVGISEVLCGILLLIGYVPTLATVVLMMIMTNFIITFQKLQYPLEHILVAIGISFLLAIRLMITSRAPPTVKTSAKKDK